MRIIHYCSYHSLLDTMRVVFFIAGKKDCVFNATVMNVYYYAVNLNSRPKVMLQNIVNRNVEGWKNQE